MSGLFVAIEGLDGTGKSTLTRGLAADLGGEPWSTPGERIQPVRGQVLAALGLDPLARALFYAATVASQGRRAREAARSGRVVVMDRYWLSTMAYARARGVDADLSGIRAGLPAPDLTLFLTLAEPERERRLRARGACTAADLETLDPAFRHTVLRCSTSVDPAFAPVLLDLTGASPRECVERAAALVRSRFDGHPPATREAHPPHVPTLPPSRRSS